MVRVCWNDEQRLLRPLRPCLAPLPVPPGWFHLEPYCSLHLGPENSRSVISRPLPPLGARATYPTALDNCPWMVLWNWMYFVSKTELTVFPPKLLLILSYLLESLHITQARKPESDVSRPSSWSCPRGQSLNLADLISRIVLEGGHFCLPPLLPLCLSCITPNWPFAASSSPHSCQRSKCKMQFCS